MNENFVPINTTKLSANVPKDDIIFTSLICKGESKVLKSAWKTHLLLTRFGIAYFSYGGMPFFHFWNENIVKIKSSVLIIGKDKFSINFRDYRDNRDAHNILKMNFIPFCNLLRENFVRDIEQIRQYFNNTELIKFKIEEIGMNDFIAEVKGFYNIGFQREVLHILNNSKQFIKYDNKENFLEVLAKMLYNFKRYEEALQCYNEILELNPDNGEAILFKVEIQGKMTQKYVPKKVRNMAQKLYKTGLKAFKKRNYNEALKYYLEALKITPFDDTIRKGLIIILDLLGKTDKLNQLLEDIFEGKIEDFQEIIDELISD